MPNTTTIYQAPNGAIQLKNDSGNETFWASQKQISQIFGIERSVVTKHIKNIFSDEEVDQKSTCAFFAQVQKEGDRDVSRNIEFYSLDIILAVGYRTSSLRAITFRKWATKKLKDHITRRWRISKNFLIILQSSSQKIFWTWSSQRNFWKRDARSLW